MIFSGGVATFLTARPGAHPRRFRSQDAGPLEPSPKQREIRSRSQGYASQRDAQAQQRSLAASCRVSVYLRGRQRKQSLYL